MIHTKRKKKQKGKMTNFTTKDTKKKLSKKECGDIGTKKSWKRNCPKCNKEIIYTHIDAFYYGRKRDSICRSCANTRHIGPFIGNCPICGKKRVYGVFKLLKYAIDNDVWCHKCAGKKTIETRIKRKNLYGNRNQSIYSKRKMSKLHKGQNNPFYGKKHISKTKKFLSKYISSLIRTPEWRRKQRLARIRNIKLLKGNVSPSYNKKSCEYFKDMELKKKWNGYYATKNGEYFIKDLGYWVDYYEPKKNIVIEWDEKSHYNVDGTLKKRDNDRMLEIKNHLNCRFYRFNEKFNTIKKY